MKLPEDQQDILKKWISALRSGDYKQGQLTLKKVSETDTSHCCLGVLCEILNINGFKELEISPVKVWGFESDATDHIFGITKDTGEITKDTGEIPNDVINENNLSFLLHCDKFHDREESLMETLIDKNDTYNNSFSEIADFLEQYFSNDESSGDGNDTT